MYYLCMYIIYIIDTAWKACIYINNDLNEESLMELSICIIGTIVHTTNYNAGQNYVDTLTVYTTY